jgi:hypothetical protein
MEATLAVAHLQPGGQQGVGEGAGLLLGLAEQMEGQSLGGAGTDTGQPLELLDQPGQGTGVTAQRRVAEAVNLGAAGAGARMRQDPPPACRTALPTRPHAAAG